MRTMHLFAGAGGGLLADLILGHTPVCAVELDPYCCAVLRERSAEGWFPGLHVHEGDVRMFDPSDWEGRVDCVAAGFPCQDISVAGKQEGVADETRSGLYREALRVFRVIRPRYLFLENVAAILSCGIGTVLGDLAGLGYSAKWCCLGADECGAPHRRKRWWCIASNSCEVGRVNSVFQEAGGSLPRAWVDVAERGWDGFPSWLFRDHDGMADWPHRVAACGNGQVPLQAAAAWCLLGGPVG
jgi:DNA (cytosine-5)-methyltransferase 1